MVRAVAVAVAPGPLLVHCFGLFWSWRATASARAGMDFVRVEKAAEKVEECIGFRLRQRLQQPSRDVPCRAGEFVEQCIAGGREGVGGGATIIRFGLADDEAALFKSLKRLTRGGRICAHCRGEPTTVLARRGSDLHQQAKVPDHQTIRCGYLTEERVADLGEAPRQILRDPAMRVGDDGRCGAVGLAHMRRILRIWRERKQIMKNSSFIFEIRPAISPVT